MAPVDEIIRANLPPCPSCAEEAKTMGWDKDPNMAQGGWTRTYRRQEYVTFTTENVYKATSESTINTTDDPDSARETYGNEEYIGETDTHGYTVVRCASCQLAYAVVGLGDGGVVTIEGVADEATRFA